MLNYGFISKTDQVNKEERIVCYGFSLVVNPIVKIFNYRYLGPNRFA